MEVTQQAMRRQTIVTDVLCDICGQSCKVDEGVVDNPVRDDHGQTYYDFEYMKLQANWGYHSPKDCEEWTAQVCFKCVEEKLAPMVKFKTRFYL